MKKIILKICVLVMMALGLSQVWIISAFAVNTNLPGHAETQAQQDTDAVAAENAPASTIPAPGTGAAVQERADEAGGMPSDRTQVSQNEWNNITRNQYNQVHQQQTIIPKPANLPGIRTDSLANDSVRANGQLVRQKILFGLLPNLMKGLLGFVAITSTVVLLIAGRMYMLAFGDEEKLTAAKKAATWAIIGLLIAIFSYAIVSIISNLPLPG